MLSLIRKNRWQRARFQGGTTLMEVLVSLLVLSGGMLGMAGVQTVSLRNNQTAYYRTQATALSLDMVERLRANIVAVQAGGYDNVAGAATASCFTAAGCNAGQMAAQDILDWSAQVAAALPNGASTVCLDATGNDGTPGAAACDGNGRVYAIKIWWDDNRDGTANQRYVTTTQPW
ncbi:MAG: type IV pilus modification protein PilV [Pseudohongiellaceae bacterium]